MPQGKQATSSKPRSAEEILQDECVSSALALLNLRRSLQNGDLSAVRKVARESARIMRLALAVETAISLRDDVFFVLLKHGGDQ